MSMARNGETLAMTAFDRLRTACEVAAFRMQSADPDGRKIVERWAEEQAEALEGMSSQIRKRGDEN
jgi:hypothetical protein